MRRSGNPLGVVNLKGYILPEKKVVKSGNADSDSGEDEEEKEPEFLDMDEMLSVSSGGRLFNSSIPAKTEVEFQDLQSGKKLRVVGCFALKDPWWEITCSAQERRKKMVMIGKPSYKLRTDLNREEGKSILSLFLTACTIPATFVQDFIQWLPNETDVGFHNLLEVLTEFENVEINRAVAQQIKSFVIHSDAGKRVQVAALYPLVMRYLPSLLPGHFTDLLDKGNERPPTTQMTQSPQAAEEDEEEEAGDQEVDLSVLAKLEEMIKTDVWKLGFNYVMSKELKLVRCEAGLRAFDECELLWQMGDLQRNALRVYDYLKSYCYRTGNTYKDIKSLCEDLRLQVGLVVETELWDAAHFLKEQGVLKYDGQKIAIRNLFFNEQGIHDCLRALVEGEPWSIPLDVRKVLCAAAEERRMKGGAGDAMDLGGGEESGIEPAATEKWNLTGIDRVDVASPCARSTAAKVECCKGTETGLPPTVHMKQDCDTDQDQATTDLDPDQVRAAEMICANPVTIISGKGGCGKTTVVSLLFKAALQQLDHMKEEVEKACADYENDDQCSETWLDMGPGSFLPHTEAQEKKEAVNGSSIQAKDEVLLTAPTGRAAAMLTKKTCFTAYTLHQVMWSFRNAKKDENGKPENWKFAPVRVLVVDEGSLVCVTLLHSILTMLTNHARLKKFVLLGDVRQLPSIMPGNILHDLFHSLTLARWAIEMKTNHRAESELIVKNSGRISDMGMKGIFHPLDFDATVDLSESCTMPSIDKSFILVLLHDDPDELPRAIQRLLADAPGLQDHKTSQFIAFRRKDCTMINDLCCKHYCNHLTKDHKSRVVFQRGDKVCCTKNGFVTDVDEEARGGAERPAWPSNTARDADGGVEEEKHKDHNKLRLCNGEIFFIEQDVTKKEDGRRRKETRYLTLRDCDNRAVTVSYRELQKECKLQHAWARTIHTFQGSETKTVVYLLGNGKAQTWKHVYTAVTRGQKRVYVVAHKGGMEVAIRTPVIHRNTRLQGLIKKLLAKPQTEGQNLPCQPGSSHPQPGTPGRPAPGFGPTQATPRSSLKPISSRALFTQSTPAISKSLSLSGEVVAVKKEEASGTSLQDYVFFTETYSWSSMSSFGDHSAELHADDITSEARNDGHVGSAQPRGSPCSKRVLSPLDSCTPKKQIKAEPKESPLGCSSLLQLTLHTPKGKKLFQDPTP